jgi:hypothetical protein
MTISTAINRTDALCANTYTREEKINWLSTLDGMVKTLVMNHYEEEAPAFNGYDSATPEDTELLIPAPFDECYGFWLCAKIHEADTEYDKYNGAIETFDAAWIRYQNWYHREHTPKGGKMRFHY